MRKARAGVQREAGLALTSLLGRDQHHPVGST